MAAQGEAEEEQKLDMLVVEFQLVRGARVLAIVVHAPVLRAPGALEMDPGSRLGRSVGR